MESPGLYAGGGHGLGSGQFVGRLRVRPLPSGSAVSIDYEAYGHENVLQHAEHSIVARDPEGRLTMVAVHSESAVPAFLVEQGRGFFLDPEPRGPYLLGIQMSFDGDQLGYSWWWASQGEELVERSRALMHLLGPPGR